MHAAFTTDIRASIDRSTHSGKLMGLLAALIAVLGVASATQAAPIPERVADRLDPAQFGGQGMLVVHYHRPADDYEGWNLWTWAVGADGGPRAFDGETTFGRYAAIPVQPGTDRQGFLVRFRDWEGKDVDRDRFVDLDADGVTEIWLVSGDTRVFTDPADIDVSTRLVGAFLDAGDAIHLTASAKLSPDQLQSARLHNDGSPASYSIDSAAVTQGDQSQGVLYRLALSEPVAFEHISNLSLHVEGLDPITVFARDVLNEERFLALDAELGSRHAPASTSFRVWSPVAESVDLLLYDSPDAPAPGRTLPMTHTGRGVWETEVAGDLHGVAYQYRYRSYGKDRVAADIHCFAATADSSRSVVLDFDRVTPPDFGNIPTPKLEATTDEIIYEIHVRDVSIDDPSLDEALRGTYLGLIHDGSIDVEGLPIATGVRHLEELGVTAVHLLPIHDFTAEIGEYNWGYWTALFNVPEGNYASDPTDPLAAPRDLKTAIHGLHSRGIRVILDVVYNHTSSSYEFSPFDQSVPYYYFRTTADGTLRNDAGVGNSIADERPMVSKYVSDSMAFWVEQYRIDGFRFDLLGTHRPESVRDWIQRVRQIRPDLTIYGEPWTGGGPTYFPKGAQRGMGIAVFNDHLRNAVRGDLDGTSVGFATGDGGDLNAVRAGIMGAIDDFADNPTEAIKYVSAHDNLTFWDKLLLARPDATDDQLRAMHKLAHGIVLTSQGVPFIHGAADFARTKGGNHNSYNAGDDVNRFDWPRKAEYAGVFEYVRGLIKLRKAHPAFRMRTRDEVRSNIRFLDNASVTDPALVAYVIDGDAAGDDWAEILVAYNGTPNPQTVTMPHPGPWTVVVDADTAGTAALGAITASAQLEPFSMIVLHR
ncbi:MAG: type I pullulanase [Planctomycetota bacterium]